MCLRTASVRRAALLAMLGLAVTACTSSHAPGTAHPAAPRPVAADSASAGALARGSTTRASSGTAEGVNTIGVMPFAVASTANDPTLAALGYALADLLTVDLARSRRLTLVERARLGDVLRELHPAAANRIDPANAPRVGRSVQARRLVLGAIGSVSTTNLLADNGTLRLGVHLADVRTGSATQAINATAPLADVLAAEKAVAFRIFDALGVVLTPSERAAVEERPTSNLAALLAYGRGVREEYDGNFRRAVNEFRRAGRLDPKFRAAASREAEARTLSETGTRTPIVALGVRSVDGAVSSAVDRLNRPLEPLSTLTRSSTPADPSFPVAGAALVITVNHP